jgi:hypothetical protein
MTCEHVRQDVLTATVTIKCVVTAIHEIEKFGNHSVDICLGYCKACAKHHGLPVVDGVLPGPASKFVDWTLLPVCSECFKVFRESLSRI